MYSYAILATDADKKVFRVLCSTDFKTGNVRDMTEADFVKELASIVRTNGGAANILNMSNFSLSHGKVIEKCGSFKRLTPSKGVVPRIVLARLASESDRTLGYTIADVSTGQISTVRKDDLYTACKKAQSIEVPFVQNGIYREADGSGALSAYPDCKFYTVVRHAAKKPAQPKVAEHIKKPSIPSELANKLQSSANTAKEEPKNTAKEQPKYTKEQMKELQMAKQVGIDLKLIANPKLSPEQMRVLWVAKRNNRYPEYYADPEFTVEQMQFFADRLVNANMFAECKGIITPKYSVEQLTELYLGIYNGVDYTQYADTSLSSEEMYIQRTKLGGMTFSELLVGTPSKTDAAVFMRKLSKAKCSSDGE